MSVDEKLIERIVANVMGQLVTDAPAVRPEPARHVAKDANAAAEDPSQSTNYQVFVLDKVITAELLKDHVGAATRIAVGPKSVLTPSAKDFLRSRNVEWLRQPPGTACLGDSARWKAITLGSAEVACRALDDMGRTGEASWHHESAASAHEAVRSAVDALCRTESDGVVVFADRAQVIACQANRNQQVRAAVANDVRSIDEICSCLGGNLLVIRPSGKTQFELRNMLRAFVSHGAPQAPSDWTEQNRSYGGAILS